MRDAADMGVRGGCGLQGNAGGVLLRCGGVSRLMMGGDTDPFMLKFSGAFIDEITDGDIDPDGPMYFGDGDDFDDTVSLLVPELLLAGDDADDSDMTAVCSSAASSSSDSVKSMTSSFAGESVSKTRTPVFAPSYFFLLENNSLKFANYLFSQFVNKWLNT